MIKVNVRILCAGASEYSYYAIPQATAYVNTVPFLGTVYFDASVISYLRQQMYVYITVTCSCCYTSIICYQCN